MQNKLGVWVALIGCIFSSCSSTKKIQQSVGFTKEQVKNTIEKVNDFWQASHPPQARAFWDNAAYQTSNMAALAITQKAAYRTYAETWAAFNEWKGAKSDDKPNWKYTYGEKDAYVLFGDWQACFQTYIDLFQLQKDSVRIRRAVEVMQYQISTPNKDYWWWADGLYMVMPVMTKMYHLTGNTRYLDKLYEYYTYADSIMYDTTEHLYYRDARYVYPKHQSVNGKKDFWARGDGWVLAALAKVLNDLPHHNNHRQFFINRYTQLAAAVKKYQQPEGYWTRSIADTAHAPGYETSGTAFFTYGLLWGINNGYLDAKTYLSTALKGWNYLQTIALQPNGSVGYVQPIGEKAIPEQVVNQNSSAGFGTGAFLLAAAEMYRYLDK